MGENKGDYRFSALGVIMFGVLLLVISPVVWLLGLPYGLAGIAWFVVLLGVGLVIAGIVRAVNSRRDSHELADRAALTIIAQATPSTTLTSELERLGSLHTSGLLTDLEFAAAKSKVLDAS